jgi:hypothetical protein
MKIDIYYLDEMHLLGEIVTHPIEPVIINKFL